MCLARGWQKERKREGAPTHRTWVRGERQQGVITLTDHTLQNGCGGRRGRGNSGRPNSLDWNEGGKGREGDPRGLRTRRRRTNERASFSSRKLFRRSFFPAPSGNLFRDACLPSQVSTEEETNNAGFARRRKINLASKEMEGKNRLREVF